MKRFFLPVLLCFFALACSDAIESNTPVIQGSVDNEFFRAPDASAVLNDDGSVTLTGKKDSRTITLQTASADIGHYTLGSNPSNVATFLDYDQTLYVAGPGSGDGMIEISEVSDGKLSGVFYFNAFSAGGEQALNFQKGVFFEVPIDNFTDDETPDSDTFTAEIDGAPFVAELVDAENNMGTLTVYGTKQLTAINLVFATDIAVGEHDLLPVGTPTATYSVNAVTEHVSSGTLTIISNDTTEKVVEGNFTFTTDVSGTLIENGAFKVSYE
ncbi:MAG TPA: DUF6252 family protein [Flavobacteriaceae bacterium]|nr:DUF6252 family protein [Flavobacteriaceae bacterium]